LMKYSYFLNFACCIDKYCVLALTLIPWLSFHLWCELRRLWIIDGFVEWLESVTPHMTQRDCSPSVIQTNPHSKYLIMRPMI
jgi:hypothetical protein